MTPLTNATFINAITNCLAEDPVTALCSNYGTSSNFGTMPNWNTSQVTSMANAFSGKTSFNGDIGAWDTSSVTSMDSMFEGASAFNQNIGSWDVSRVNNTIDMFHRATSFNQDISNWDVSNVISSRSMLRAVPNFAHDLNGWNMISLINSNNMFNGSTTILAAPYSAPVTPTCSNYFTCFDVAPPTLFSSSPADEATGVAVGSNIVLTFSQNIQAGTGNIVISDGSGDARTIAIGDAQITISGATLTINPTADLNSSTAYYVQIDAAAVDDLSANSYAGIADTTTLNFTTAAPADTTAPAITGPSGGAGVATSAITVNENQTAVTQFTANEAISSWTLSGDDAAKFAIAADGTLTFVAAPDFENPTDVGDTANNNTYVVIITATDSSSNTSSQTLTVTVANVEDTPAEAFAANAQTIRQVITDEANRSLRNTVSANRNVVQGARDRFVDNMGQNAACGRDDQIDQVDSAYSDFEEICTETVVTRNNIPFDVDGVFRLSGPTLSTNGTFFGQNGSADGTWRRLFFGDFNVQWDGNTGSNTGTLSARVAWEQMVSETTMLGYFIGAELGDSDIRGSFVGDQHRVALILGGYAVHQLAEQVYLDGFLTFGAGRNDLSMSNDVLALDSDYNTRTATLGAAVSGIYEYEAYEFHPELSFSYGHTWIGNVGFTGQAYGLVDNTLSLDAGNVSVANLIFRPEVIWGLDAGTVAESNSQLSFAPRMICEWTRSTRRTEACGGGVELGLGIQSDDGLTNAEFRVLMDRVGSSERTSYAINLEHRF